MKSRNLYYRRKDKSIVMEGKQDGKSILIWTLPDAETLWNEIVSKASFISSEKLEKIRQKIERLDMRENKPRKVRQKVRLRDINRIEKKDAEKEISEEEQRSLWELTK